MPKISIVMPVFIFSPPQIRWMEEAIESIQNQTFQDWELIIVDDGSQLDFKESIPLDRRIKVYHKEHGGVAKARNFGISKMTGQFYTAQDADDSSDPERLELMLNSLEKKKADMCFSDMYICSMDKYDLTVRKTGKFDGKRLAKEQNIPYFVMVRASKMVKYRDRYTANDDWMFIVDLVVNGCKVVKVSKPLMIYRRNPMSVSVRTMYDGRKERELKWCHEDISKVKNKLEKL
jgi:glycosyltransferase involved in cell wall biosynthesis